MANMDVSMLIFMLNEVIPHLPKGLNYVLIYELPWLLSKIVNTTISCLPSEYKKLAKTSSKKDIHNWVAKESLPDFMGGTCDINYRRAPKNAKTLEEMAERLKLSEKDIRLIEKTYQPYLDEADQAMAARRQGKNLRRRSSVLEFWHWMKNKIDGSGPLDGQSNDEPGRAGAASKKISVINKDGPKLASIADGGDE